MLKPIEENRKKQIQFIAAASHELRSPLTVILSNTAAVKGAVLPNGPHFLDTIESEGNRMARLISDMLQLASADNHTWSMTPEAIELDTLLLQIWEDFEPQANARRLTWEIHLPEDALPPCRCDRQRIRQLIGILIDNAFCYTPEGGRVALSFAPVSSLPASPSPLPPAKKSRSLFSPGRAAGREVPDGTHMGVRICVSDNGPGIPDEEKEAVFDRFHRLDRSRKDKSHFGLGLSIAKEIVCLHHGSLTLSDTPGGGSTFSVLLPLSSEMTHPVRQAL